MGPEGLMVPKDLAGGAFDRPFLNSGESDVTRAKRSRHIRGYDVFDVGTSRYSFRALERTDGDEVSSEIRGGS